MLTAVCLGGVTVGLESRLAFMPSGAFEPFVSRGRPDELCRLLEREELPEIPGRVIHDGYLFDIVRRGDGRLLRRFRDRGDGGRIYALGIPSESGTEVLYLRGKGRFFGSLSGVFSHIGIERLLLAHRRLILHACCVETALGGLLFSGPSGCGKSTQGELWRRRENARLLNGDRPIVGVSRDGWLAYGSPYAGSSRCHINDCTPVRAIVMLKKGSACAVRPLAGAEAFRALFRQVTLNTWDPEYMAEACLLTQRLLDQVPVYALTATPDAAAVEILKRTLQGEERK